MRFSKFPRINSQEEIAIQSLSQIADDEVYEMSFIEIKFKVTENRNFFQE